MRPLRFLFHGLVHGFGDRFRWLRYTLVLALGGLLFGGLAGAYYIVTPKTYVSGFTLILPGTGAGSSVNLEELGQASSVSSSPFSSPNVSPTENYKRLLTSDRVRGRAASILQMSSIDLDRPRIRLVDQTPLIYISLKAGDPYLVNDRALAWHDAFQLELDALRAEEIAARQSAYEASIAGFEQAVADAQAEIITFQTRHGLISLDEFSRMVSDSSSLRAERDAALTESAAKNAEAQRLAAILNLSAEAAGYILILKSDPTYTELLANLAECAAELARLGAIYGAAHPEMRSETERHASLFRALAARGQALIGIEIYSGLELAQINAEGERASLISELAILAAASRRASAEAEALNQRLAENVARVEDLSEPAAELDRLLRNHQIAETVFASALARVDTARADIFSSYPLAQTLEAPAIPDRHVSPSKKIALLAAIGGFFVYAMGVMLLWLRLPLIRVLWKII